MKPIPFWLSVCQFPLLKSCSLSHHGEIKQNSTIKGTNVVLRFKYVIKKTIKNEAWVERDIFRIFRSLLILNLLHCYLSRIKKQHLFTCIFQMYITIIELRCYEDNCIWYTFDFKGTTQNTSMDFIVFIVFNQTCLERNNCNVYSKYEYIYQDSICRRFLKKKMVLFCRLLQIFKVHPVL